MGAKYMLSTVCTGFNNVLLRTSLSESSPSFAELARQTDASLLKSIYSDPSNAGCIYAGCIALAYFPNSASHTGSRPWYCGACLALAGRPPICANSAAFSLLVQAVVHCGPLSKGM